MKYKLKEKLKNCTIGPLTENQFEIAKELLIKSGVKWDDNILIDNYIIVHSLGTSAWHNIGNNFSYDRKSFDDCFVYEDIGTFMWAVEQMGDGKEVRRKTFSDKSSVIIQDKIIRWVHIKGMNCYYADLKDIEATDWEIFEENDEIFEDLWGKISSNPIGYGDYIPSADGKSYQSHSYKGNPKLMKEEIKKAIKRAKELRE